MGVPSIDESQNLTSTPQKHLSEVNRILEMMDLPLLSEQDIPDILGFEPEEECPCDDGSFAPEAYWGGMETGLVSLYELSGDVPRTVEQLVNERTMEILSGAFDPPIVEDKFVDNVIGTVSP